MFQTLLVIVSVICALVAAGIFTYIAIEGERKEEEKRRRASRHS